MNMHQFQDFLTFFARMEIEFQLNRFVASTFLSICITAYCTAIYYHLCVKKVFLPLSVAG